MKQKSDPIRTVVVVSDLHVGSTVGLWPPDFVSQEDVPIGQSRFQKWLWECWLDLDCELDNYLRGAPCAVVFNGDLCEGITKFLSVQTMTPNASDHMEAVKQVIAPLTSRAASVFLVKGTELHTKDREVTLGAALGTVKDPSTGQHAFDKLHLDVHGCRCVFRHHCPTAMRPYLEATALSTELGSEIINAARCGHKIPQVLCMAHRHRHDVFRDSGGLVCTTGGWQALTRHGHRVVGSAVPNPSCVVLDWRGKRKGELPHVEDFVYTPKQPAGIEI